MVPKRDEFDDMMPNYNNNGSFPNTKTECLSPASTKSESVDSKAFGSRRRLKVDRSPSISNRSASVSNRSNRRGDVRGIIAPSSKDRQLMRQVSGLGLDDFGEKEEAGVQERVILEAGRVGGVIAPSRRQRQLMRQVSGLGMVDPVFGMHFSLDDSISKAHASNFFEDMDINDVPEEYRNEFSVASDHTDVVDTEDGQSYDSKSFAGSAPLGLLETGSAAAMAPTPKLRRGKKPRPKSKEQATSQSNVPEPLYVPPAAVFGTTSRRRASNDSERQRRGSSGFGSSFYAERRGSNGSTPSDCKADRVLAAQVDAMLVSMNDSKAGSMHSRGNSSRHSRTSHNGHPGPNGPLRGKRPKPIRQDSRSISVNSNTYVPTHHKDGQSQRGERYLPESMDDIFNSSKKSSDRREKKKKSSTDEKKKKKKSKRPNKSKSLPSQL